MNGDVRQICYNAGLTGHNRSKCPFIGHSEKAVVQSCRDMEVMATEVGKRFMKASSHIAVNLNGKSDVDCDDIA